MKKVQMKLSALIKKARAAKGMTQKQVADAIKVSSGRLAQWESGHDDPNQERLEQLSKLLDFSIDKPVKVEKSVNVEKILQAEKPAKKEKPAQAEKKPEAKVKKKKKKSKAKSVSKPIKVEEKPAKAQKIAKVEKKPEPKAKVEKKSEPKVKAKPQPKSKKLDNSYGKELKALRISKDLSQKQVADALKLSPGRIAQWENGRAIPNAERKKQLNDLLQKGIKQAPKAADPKAPSKTPKAAPNKKKVGNKDILLNIKSLATDTGMSINELIHILNLCGLKIEKYQVRVEDITPDIIDKIKAHNGAAKRECIKDDEIFIKDVECLKNLSAKRIDSVLRKLAIAKVRRYAEGELKFGKTSKSAILKSDASKLENYFNRYTRVGEILNQYIH